MTFIDCIMTIHCAINYASICSSSHNHDCHTLQSPSGVESLVCRSVDGRRNRACVMHAWASMRVNEIGGGASGFTFVNVKRLSGLPVSGKINHMQCTPMQT